MGRNVGARTNYSGGSISGFVCVIVAVGSGNLTTRSPSVSDDGQTSCCWHCRHTTLTPDCTKVCFSRNRQHRITTCIAKHLHLLASVVQTLSRDVQGNHLFQCPTERPTKKTVIISLHFDHDLTISTSLTSGPDTSDGVIPRFAFVQQSSTRRTQYLRLRT